MLTANQSFKLYDLVFKHFKNEEDAKAFVAEIEQTIESRFVSEKDILATKSDILGLKTEMQEIKVDLIKWVFSFFVAMAVMIIGLYIKK